MPALAELQDTVEELLVCTANKWGEGASKWLRGA